MKILLDMNLSPSWVEFLSGFDIPARHWSSVGAIAAPDILLMEYAAEHGFVVLTHDLDFGAVLAATQKAKPSVVQIRSDDLRFNAIGAAVVSALRQVEAEFGSGVLVTVEPGRTRLRILPLNIS